MKHTFQLDSKGNLFVVRTKMLPGETQASTYSSITAIRSGEVGC